MDTPRVNVTLRQPCADLRGADWQASNADAVLLEHDEAALLERFDELREVRQQQQRDERQGGAAALRTAKDVAETPAGSRIHGRPRSGCVVHRGSGQDLLVQRTLQVVLPYMHRIVPGVPKLFGDPGRQHHVDQELHEPCDISGSSRSRTVSAA